MYDDHVLYTNADKDAPASIKDRHDDVALDLCKYCHKGEIELEGPCVNQDRPPNWRTGGLLFLVRCFACDPEKGRENYALCVSGGICAWCGWRDKKDGNLDGGNHDPRTET
jgi:hypothetical protein